MTSLLLRFALLLMSLPAVAANATFLGEWNVSQSTHLVLVSTSACKKACEDKYAKCAKGNSGKDMKQCADERKVCYKPCL